MNNQRMRYSPDFIICPKCVEMLTRDDVEGFHHCPYCNHKFEVEVELEEFLLQPIIEHWMRQAKNRHNLFEEISS